MNLDLLVFNVTCVQTGQRLVAEREGRFYLQEFDHRGVHYPGRAALCKFAQNVIYSSGQHVLGFLLLVHLSDPINHLTSSDCGENHQ